MTEEQACGLFAGLKAQREVRHRGSGADCPGTEKDFLLCNWSFLITEKVFSAMEKVFSVMEKVLSAVE